MFLLSSLAAFGCGPEKEIPQGPTFLRIQVDNPRPNAFQSSVNVSVSCDISWSAELSDKSWAKIENLVRNEGAGGSFTVTLSPNTGKDPRETVIKVMAGQGSTTATIIQEGLDTFFKPSTITLSGTMASNVNFTSPADWTAEIASGEAWLTLRTKGGKVGAAVLTCLAKDDNRNVGAREGAIRVTIGTVSVEIPVVQGQKDVILGENEGTQFDWKGGPFTVHTQSNVDYRIDSSADWIVHTETRALNEATEVFLVKPNENSVERRAVIRFTGENGGTLLNVSVNPHFLAEAYYIVVDDGDERILTYKLPDSVTSRFQTFDLSALGVDFSGKNDLFVGLAVDRCSTAFGAEKPFFASRGTGHFYLSPFSLQHSDWEQLPGWDLELSATIVGHTTPRPHDSATSFAEMGYNAIADPGNGSYAAGTAFQLQRELADGPAPKSVSWSFDGAPVSASTPLTLPAGPHTVTALLTFPDGGTETLELTLDVK